MVNQIKMGLNLPINTQAAKEVEEALNGQSEIAELKDQLTHVKELLNKMIDSNLVRRSWRADLLNWVCLHQGRTAVRWMKWPEPDYIHYIC